MVKIGITTYSLVRELKAGKMNIFDVIKWVAANGGSHVEISPSNVIPVFQNENLCKEIISCAQDNGIDISCYTVGANFIQADENAFQNEIARVKKEVDTAAMLGVKIMRHDAGWSDQNDLDKFEATYLKVADGIKEVADYAKQYEITTMVENHGFLFQGSERVARLIKAVGRDNFRQLLDVGNCLCSDEDPIANAKNNIKYAKHIHFKDFLVRKELAVSDGFFKSSHGKYLRGTIIGNGDVDTKALAEIIKSSGYNGYISAEFEGPEECVSATLISMKTLLALFA